MPKERSVFGPSSYTPPKCAPVPSDCIGKVHRIASGALDLPSDTNKANLLNLLWDANKANPIEFAFGR